MTLRKFCLLVLKPPRPGINYDLNTLEARFTRDYGVPIRRSGLSPRGLSEAAGKRRPDPRPRSWNFYAETILVNFV